MTYPERIEDLPNNGLKVILMRRTTNDTVKTSIGYRGAYGEIHGWFGAKPPTHFIGIPPFAQRRRTP